VLLLNFIFANVFLQICRQRSREKSTKIKVVLTKNFIALPQKNFIALGNLLGLGR
jgi:hypothetical protein